MLSLLQTQPEDKILALMQKFRTDPRPVKIDLGVGVYRDAAGNTPVMRAIKAAERELWEVEATKSYVALAGDPGFSDVMVELVLGDAIERANVAAVATPGGTGALRQMFELIRFATPGARVFVPDPTWPNHLGILNYLGIETVTYRYYNAQTGGLDFDGMIEDLGDLRPRDAVLLHGCCHNPTGANPTMPQWQAVIDVINAKEALPLIDIAYQGFGDGLDADAAPTRLVARSCPEVLIAASCSKNFGIYRERTGILMAVGHDADLIKVAQENLVYVNRLSYSFPPDHGARLVTMVLRNDALRADWQAELEAVRLGMVSLRTQLAEALRAQSGSDRFGFLAQHRGMFSRLGATPEQVERLRAEHAIYMVGDSRMNIAGLNAETIPILAKAIVEVGI